MPITSVQGGLLRALAAQRSPASFVAGGIAINRAGPRYSADADGAALILSGYTVALGRTRPGRREATITRDAGSTELEWVADSAFRFYPAQPDPVFGYVLHPVDLATAAIPSEAVGVVFLKPGYLSNSTPQPSIDTIVAQAHSPASGRCRPTSTMPCWSTITHPAQPPSGAKLTARTVKSLH